MDYSSEPQTLFQRFKAIAGKIFSKLWEHKKPIVGISIVLGLLIAIYVYYVKYIQKTRRCLLSGQTDGSSALTIPVDNIPELLDEMGHSYSISTWIKIDQLLDQASNFGTVISRANTFSMGIGKRGNDIELKVYSVKYDVPEIIIIQNLPVQTWVNIIVNVSNRNVEVWINGELHASHVLNTYANIAQDKTIIIAPSGKPFSGLIGTTFYFNIPLSINDIQSYAGSRSVSNIIDVLGTVHKEDIQSIVV